MRKMVQSQPLILSLVVFFLFLWPLVVWLIQALSPDPNWGNMMHYRWLYSLQVSTFTVVPFYLFLRGSWAAFRVSVKNTIPTGFSILYALCGVFWLINIIHFLLLSDYIVVDSEAFEVFVFALTIYCIIVYNVLMIKLSSQQERAFMSLSALIFVLFWMIIIMLFLG